MNRALLLLVPAVTAVLLAGCSPAKKTCLSPNISCDGKCVDPTRDPANCGTCGVTCGAGQTCCGICTDLQTDAENCNACGARCPTNGGVCAGGACSCPSGLTACGANPGACVDLAIDPHYCGTCGHDCVGPDVATSTVTCSSGACTCGGTPDSKDCGGNACVNTVSGDPANCGGCGLQCAPRATCASSACTCGNAAYPNDCGAAPGGTGCVSFATDPAHCGNCITACSGSTPSCSNGLCCATGATNCSGACVDTQTSTANCGACGNACAAGQVCSAGKCTCSAGQIACGTTCCAGNACCGTGGSSCQTGHSNGLGQTFYDCTTTYVASSLTLAAANAAAQAWGVTPMSANTICGFPCVAGQKPGVCAIWCYTDTASGLSSLLTGRVLQISTPACSALACPNDGTAFVLWGTP